MTTPNIEGININTQINEIKDIFESDKIASEINSAVMTKKHQYEKIVSGMEDSYKKDYAGKLSRLKKFFSSSKKQDYESFKFKVAEYIEKFKTIKEKVYNDLKNNKRIIAPDTASKKITQEIYFQQRKLESVDDEIDALNSAISKREEKIKLWRQGLHPARFDIDENKAKKEIDRLDGEMFALGEEIKNTKSDDDKKEKEQELECLKLERAIYNTFEENEKQIRELEEKHKSELESLNGSIFSGKIAPEEAPKQLELLSDKHRSEMDELIEKQKAGANQQDDTVKKAISKFIDHLKSKKEEDEKKREDLKKLQEDITKVIKGLKEKRKSFVDNNKGVPVLFSNLIKCLENCVARLQKLQKAFGKESSKKINASSTKQSIFGFAGPEPDSAAVSDSAARARAYVSLTESDKAKKSENVKKYNAAVKKFTWLRLVFSDSAKKKIDDINELAKVHRRKLSITDDWLINYIKIELYSDVFYNSRINFLSGEEEVPEDFDNIYNLAKQYYKKNTAICDMLCGNQKLDMSNLYVYDLNLFNLNPLGHLENHGGKFSVKIPKNYSSAHTKYLRCINATSKLTTDYYSALQKCCDIAKSENLKDMYDHDRGRSQLGVMWCIVDSSKNVIAGPSCGKDKVGTINNDKKNEPARKEVELVIRASNIAGGWLNINNFS